MPNRTGFLLALPLTSRFFLTELLVEGQLSSSAASVLARGELCCWPRARGKHRPFRYFTPGQASGTQDALLQSPARFPRQEDFFLALSAAEVREGAAARKEAADFAQAGQEAVAVWCRCRESFEASSHCQVENESINPTNLRKSLMFFAFWLSRFFQKRTGAAGAILQETSCFPGGDSQS